MSRTTIFVFFLHRLKFQQREIDQTLYNLPKKL